MIIIYVSIFIPIAFLEKDQMDNGLLRGEQTALLAILAAGLVLRVSDAALPLGPIATVTLVYFIIRRIVPTPGRLQIRTQEAVSARPAAYGARR